MFLVEEWIIIIRLGFFITPRFHAKYIPWEKGVLFFCWKRKASLPIFLLKIKYFASSRTISILDNGKIYGLNPEIAWNYGVSFTKIFSFFEKKGCYLDFYRTDFQNQIVVDVMQSPQYVLFYDLKGKSFANSLQFDFNYEILKHFNLCSGLQIF